MIAQRVNYHVQRTAVYFPVSIVGGGMFGAIFAGVSFSVGGSTFEFGSGFGLPIGFVIGGAFAALSYWPLRNENMGTTFLVLALLTASGGAFALAFSHFFISPEMGPVSAWLGCMSGYWLGVCAVGLKIRKPQKEAATRGGRPELVSKTGGSSNGNPPQRTD